MFTVEVIAESQSVIPKKMHSTDACYDLCSNEQYTIAPHQWELIDTGIELRLPPGLQAKILSRSGLAVKHGIFVLNSPGTIDPGYQGRIKVILINMSDKPFVVELYNRIAQIEFVPVTSTEFKVTLKESTEKSTSLQSERGKNGFGSTGVN